MPLSFSFQLFYEDAMLEAMVLSAMELSTGGYYLVLADHMQRQMQTKHTYNHHMHVCVEVSHAMWFFVSDYLQVQTDDAGDIPTWQIGMKFNDGEKSK